MRPAHQQRVINEKRHLDEKLSKLGMFLAGAFFSSLDVAEQERMRRQRGHMQGYSDVLGERIAAFKAGDAPPKQPRPDGVLAAQPEAAR